MNWRSKYNRNIVGLKAFFADESVNVSRTTHFVTLHRVWTIHLGVLRITSAQNSIQLNPLVMVEKGHGFNQAVKSRRPTHCRTFLYVTQSLETASPVLESRIPTPRQLMVLRRQNLEALTKIILDIRLQFFSKCVMK